MALCATVASASRIKMFDFPTPWTDESLQLLIEYPTSTENLAAIIKPFDYQVFNSAFKLVN